MITITWEDLPKEIKEKMLEYQVAQGNKKKPSIFVHELGSAKYEGGFSWADSPEGFDFWKNVLEEGNFKIFFDKYPKSELNFEKLDELNKIRDEIVSIEEEINKINSLLSSEIIKIYIRNRTNGILHDTLLYSSDPERIKSILSSEKEELSKKKEVLIKKFNNEKCNF